jgi:hypothetical protein
MTSLDGAHRLDLLQRLGGAGGFRHPRAGIRVDPLPPQNSGPDSPLLDCRENSLSPSSALRLIRLLWRIVAPVRRIFSRSSSDRKERGVVMRSYHLRRDGPRATISTVSATEGSQLLCTHICLRAQMEAADP